VWVQFDSDYPGGGGASYTFFQVSESSVWQAGTDEDTANISDVFIIGTDLTGWREQVNLV